MPEGPSDAAASVDSSQSGKYRVLLELGQGGTAIVYLALAHGPVGFNKLIVLKALKSGLANDTEFRRMFLNEARLSARLSHPNIVQVNEIVEQDGVPIIVMEYLEGKPLSEIRSRVGDKFDLHLQLRIISDVLSGLHYSHELTDYDGTPLNVVHRDMSPHNVFVTYDGQVKVLDFGIAKLSGSLVETQTGVIKGKLRYMPPEQIAADQVDRRADIFAVGVMLWEAATNKRMWADLSEPVIMNRVLNGDIPSPREFNPRVSPELERIVMKALAHSPDQRYATAVELQVDVDTLLGDQSAAISVRDIGQFVTKYFGEARSETRRSVERHLKQVSLATAEGKQKISFPPPPNSLTQQSYTSSSSQTFRTDAFGRHPRRTIALGLGAALLVGAVAAIGFNRWSASASAENKPNASASIAVAAPSAVPTGPAIELDEPSEQAAVKKIQVRVTAYPSDATILLDGRPLPKNPFTDMVLADGVRHRFEAQADGHNSASSDVTFDNDVEVVLKLTKQRPRGRLLPRPVPTVTAQPPRRSECDPPFIVDERGVKKFKPNCL